MGSRKQLDSRYTKQARQIGGGSQAMRVSDKERWFMNDKGWMGMGVQDNVDQNFTRNGGSRCARQGGFGCDEQ